MALRNAGERTSASAGGSFRPVLVAISALSVINMLTAENERYIRKMLADREYYGAANDAIPSLLSEVDRLREEREQLHAVANAAHKWRAASVSTVRYAAEYELCAALDLLEATSALNKAIKRLPKADLSGGISPRRLTP